MRAIQKVGLASTAILLVIANVHAGRWLSRDPIEDGAGFVERDPVPGSDFVPEPQNEPYLYAFARNNPVNEIDGLGLVTVGFYGADTWFTFPVPANEEMARIAQAVGAPPPYRSLNIWGAYQYLLTYFRAQAGMAGCTNNEPIKIFGHSWGGISAVKLSRWLGRSELRNHEIDVYTIDPVSSLRLPPTGVPSNVTTFWNRYQTHGNGVFIPVYGNVHGRMLTSHAKSSDQLDLNPDGKQTTTAYNGIPMIIDHWTIIWDVQDELINLLK